MSGETILATCPKSVFHIAFNEERFHIAFPNRAPRIALPNRAPESRLRSATTGVSRSLCRITRQRVVIGAVDGGLPRTAYC